MKSRVFAMLSSLTLLTAAAALAQDELAMRADVPFDFRIGTAILRAGQYDVRPQSGGLMLIRNVDGSSAAMTLTYGARVRETAGPGALVFNRYGKTYFLAAVCNSDSSEGRQVIKSKREREFARDNSPAPPVRVALARQ
jgi:hypothetical protein